MAFLVLEKPEMPNWKFLLQHFPNKKNYLDDLLMFLAKQFWWNSDFILVSSQNFPGTHRCWVDHPNSSIFLSGYCTIISISGFCSAKHVIKKTPGMNQLGRFWGLCDNDRAVRRGAVVKLEKGSVIHSPDQLSWCREKGLWTPGEWQKMQPQQWH